ncbi:MAG: diguanylate cyclase [Oscillospiraceae bacterium]|nr:diguanylate cyclase [Oscillospiraceae bacterium]
MKQNKNLISLIYREKPLWVALLSSAVIMALLILFVFIFKAPNPNMILIAGLVVCSAVFGYPGGLVAGVLMLGYTLYFFSSGHNFVSFTDENMQKVFISIIGIVVDMVFVCELKRGSDKALRDVQRLSDALEEDNRLLQQISLIDPLTNCRNRLSLRHDFPSYLHRPVIVMMLDVDDFKSINDTFGHDQGDKALEITGKLLTDTFGKDHSYRYGGDEFMVICTDTEKQEFMALVDKIMNNRPSFKNGEEEIHINYSIGYSTGKPDDDSNLRNLFLLADKRLYQAKREGKNMIVGN